MRTWGQGRGLKSFDEITCKAKGTSLLSLSYTYDAAGNIQTVSKSGTVYYQYAYDELGQLIREDNKDANKSYTYTYDSRGTSFQRRPMPSLWEPSARLKRLTVTVMLPIAGRTV